MFLPVILVSEFGIGGWFVFAVPNIVGAAAMGWTLARRGASERIVIEHRTACLAFSAVTLAFQAFFLIWLTSVGVIPHVWAISAVVIGSLLGIVRRDRADWDLWLAWGVLAFSLTVFGKGLMHATIPHLTGQLPDRAVESLLCLTPVCAFGFLLCPYLDLTFHRAKQATSPAAGRFAFTLGFGLFFLVMILLTLLYEGDLTIGRGSFTAGGIFGLIGLHVAVQIGFKFSAHLRAIPGPKAADGLLWVAAGSLVVAAVFAMRQEQFFGWVHDRQRQMLMGELIYRLFMSFYGLIFPSYVWMCIVPIAGRVLGPSKPALIAWALGIAVAAPMFWIGFIDEKMPWLVVGVAAVLLSRAFVPQPRMGSSEIGLVTH